MLKANWLWCWKIGKTKKINMPKVMLVVSTEMRNIAILQP
ncbi:hypothetical protein CK203_029683 [Vitis vinifera]|uniref:Uncharacterized protein n=1 Tax=Vitis vinifera TaxID=29760 RepID=A0A438IIE6_VITVI|nr:hypothetical protein CK203_029683 [Vitis vinifera]